MKVFMAQLSGFLFGLTAFVAGYLQEPGGLIILLPAVILGVVAFELDK